MSPTPRVPIGRCEEWPGGINKSGYGVTTVAGRTRYAHRVAYEEFLGPLDERLVVDHLCGNRRCVNPDHLEQVTLAENARRGQFRRRARERGEEWNPVITAEEAIARGIYDSAGYPVAA